MTYGYLKIRRLLTIALLAGGAPAAAVGQVDAPARAGAVPDYEQHGPPSRVGLGAQVGDPSGITLKVYRRQKSRSGILAAADAYSFLVAWDLDRFFYVNAHAIHERALEDSPLNYYIGPGLIVGFRDNSSRDGDFVAGVSGDFGLNFFTERFEVFLGLTPWFRIIPDPGLYLGGGVGLRYYP